VSGSQAWARTSGPFIRNLFWHIPCPIILMPHAYWPEDTFIWRKRKPFFTWNGVTIVPVDMNHNLWSFPVNSKKSCGCRGARTAGNTILLQYQQRSRRYKEKREAVVALSVWRGPFRHGIVHRYRQERICSTKSRRQPRHGPLTWACERMLTEPRLRNLECYEMMLRTTVSTGHSKE
jgi:hypothetical protein